MNDSKLVWRIWYYFRRGHGNYLSFFMSLGTFTIVSYKLLIEKMPMMEGIFNNMTVFLLIFIICYGILTVIIGWQDMKRGSYRTESVLIFDRNPRFAEMYDRLERIEKILECRIG